MEKRINVTRSSMPSFEEYCEEIRDLWESHWLTNMGVKHKQLQAQLEEYLDTPHVILYTNGHLALENVIAAMDFPAGGEVITTPFTFVSTTHAIVRNGLVPVFCDINDTDYTMDVTKIEGLITEKTVAIVPVHVYGNLCDVDAIRKIADKHGLKVIYDAAHAFGVSKNGVNAANMGDASMFSFHATKVFNTIEGGAVSFRDDMVQKMNDLKNFGIRGPERVAYVGGNAKMSEFQAAMGICNLRHVNGEIAKRKAIVERYRSHLSGIPGIRLCDDQPGVVHNYAYFPVVFDGYKYDRDEVFAKLAENNIVARKYFYPLTNDIECYQELPTAGAEKTPVAKFVADRVLTLPLYADLSMHDVDRICDTILA
ncbi:MAG: DegT/DnrJ/EryC1/StrS family aminotransferase [Ruminococcaceae bacterium]|nr:DegT/DnrJ/EryC1/StrS family aminotransferase [Oscillospiraceae bacterium]